MYTGWPSPQRILVFDSPRCCSQLFRKLFAYHPDLDHIFEPFQGASFFGPKAVVPLLESSPAAKDAVQKNRAMRPDKLDETFSMGNQQLRADIETSQAREKIPWIKDHAIYLLKPEIILTSLRSTLTWAELLEQYPGNPTNIDDDLLESLTPVCLIRHPALVVRSYWEVSQQHIGSEIEDEQFRCLTSVRWTRLIFDYICRSYDNRIHPVVVDAEDVVHRTEELTEELCEKLNLSPSGVAFSWESEEPENNPGDFFFARLKASNGVQRDDGPSERNMDVKLVVAKWTEKYGEQVAESLRKRVEQELPDYEYLRQFKLLPDTSSH